MLRSTLVVLLFFGWLWSKSQDRFNYLGARFNVGYVLIHSQDLRPIGESYPKGLELEFGKHNTSEKAWKSCNCFPKSGVTLTFWDFDNREVLGYGLTAMYFVQPVFAARKKLSFSVRAAFGLSYQSKPYDEETNPDNLSYSTYVAFPLQVGIATHYKFAPRWNLDINFVYNHISNGGMKEPNKGINWPTLAVGVSRYFQETQFPERQKTDWRTEDKKKNRFDLTLFGTYHEPSSKLFYLSGGMEFKYARRVSRINNLSAGTEWMYDQAQANLSTETEKVNGNIWGVAIGNEFILGQFLFGQQFGVYVIKPSTRPQDMYQRYSLVYHFGIPISLGASLKVHGHVADFLDLRLGYSF